MRAALLAALAVGAFTLAGCDAPAPAKETPAAETPAAAPPPPPPEPAAEPASSAVPGLTEAYKTEAEWLAACKGAATPIPESVCTCVSKAAVKEIGTEGYYNWLFEYFVNRDGFAKSRADRWFEAKGLDKAKMQKLADETRKCYA